jgi:hypothetical protein
MIRQDAETKKGGIVATFDILDIAAASFTLKRGA